MVTTHQILHHPFIQRLRRLPKRAYLLAGSSLLAILYLLFFVIPHSIAFSYADKETCVSQLTLAPSLRRTVDASKFRVGYAGLVKIGTVTIFSTKTCIVPTAQPESGSQFVVSAPFGGWLFRHNFSVTTPVAPTANTQSLQAAVPVTRPLTIALSAPDVVHTYNVTVDSHTADCQSKGSNLLCDLPSLHLDQGKVYTLQLQRRFQGGNAKKVTTSRLTTLTATTIIDGTLKPNDIIYAKPQEFTFVADKPLRSVTAELTQAGSKLATTTAIDDAKVAVKLSAELNRDADYTLTLKNLEAVDGSSLIEPYSVPFHVSAGPKVTGVNIGKTGVAPTAQVVVSFDQALSPTQDISKLITISGGSAVISRNGSQVVYSLQSLPLCTSFTLTIAKGLMSSYDIESTSSWSYTARTVCHSTSTYGYSVRGRPLTAYYFGASGPTTMYVGAIHGNEPSSSSLMKAWIDHLEANPSLYTDKRIVIIPTINPDGVIGNTRTNAHGVNLNRNFPTSNWVSNINDTDGQHQGGGGSAPLSEPEASALAALTTTIHPRLLLSFHAVGSLVIGDPGGYSAPYAARYASIVGYTNATGGANTFDYDVTGAYEDWTYANQGIPSMVVELGSYSYYNFAYHQDALGAMLR